MLNSMNFNSPEYKEYKLSDFKSSHFTYEHMHRPYPLLAELVNWARDISSDLVMQGQSWGKVQQK